MAILEATKAIDWKNIASRAAWTLLQAFLASALVFLDPIIDSAFTKDWDGVLALAVSAMIAGIAAAASALKTIILSLVEELKQREG